MNNARAHSARLASLLQSLRAQGEPPVWPGAPASHELVRGFLLWEASLDRAQQAYERLMRRLVDLNELRVCLVDEIVAIIGERYPKARQRASRLRRALGDLFSRDAQASIDHLRETPALDAAEYLASLDGMVPCVAAHVRLHALGHPVLPIDRPMLQCLARHDVVDPLASPEEAAEWIVDQIEPDECAEMHLRLCRWASAVLSVGDEH